MQLEQEGYLLKNARITLNYIPEIVFLIIFTYVVYNNIDNIMDNIMGNLFYSNISFSVGENPSMPCGLDYSHVVVTNNTLFPLNMAEWRFGVGDERYTFPDRWLWPGQSIKVWNGVGIDDQENLYVGHSKNIWRGYEVMTLEVSNLYGLVGFSYQYSRTCDPLW